MLRRILSFKCVSWIHAISISSCLSRSLSAAFLFWMPSAFQWRIFTRWPLVERADPFDWPSVGSPRVINRGRTPSREFDKFNITIFWGGTCAVRHPKACTPVSQSAVCRGASPRLVYFKKRPNQPRRPHPPVQQIFAIPPLGLLFIHS